MVEDAMGTPGGLGIGTQARRARAALYLAARDPAEVTTARLPAGKARAPAASAGALQNPPANIEYSGRTQFVDSFESTPRIRVLPAAPAY